MPPFYADSTLRLASDYGSAGDLFARLPGVSLLDRGGIGLPAHGFLFAAPASAMHLVYDGLRLDDPLTGRADLNLIPVESIARQAFFIDPLARDFSGLPSSQTLEIAGRDLAADTLRSQVAYRTGGYGYDDIDVRAGLRYSPRLRINAGGVLKNYAGVALPYGKYRAQKFNLGLVRTFGDRWRLDYRLLSNVSDLDLPLPGQPLLVPALQQPHQKESRQDHGLTLQYAGSWRTMIQFTDQHRERYAFRHGLWDEAIDLRRIDLRSEYRHEALTWQATAGAGGLWTDLESAAWGRHDEQLTAAWANALIHPASRLAAFMQLRVEKSAQSDAALLPQLQLRYTPGAAGRRQAAAAGTNAPSAGTTMPSANTTTPPVDTYLPSATTGMPPTPAVAPWQAVLWYERSRAEASLAARHEASPFGLGNAALRPFICDHLGLGLRHSSPRLELFAAAGVSRLRDEILLTWDAGRLLPVYANQEARERISIDLAAEWRLSDWISLGGKAKKLFSSGAQPLNVPETAGSGWLQLHHVFFRGDLDLRLSFGCSWWGDRPGSEPWYVEAGPQATPLEAVAVPWFNLGVVIRDAALFLGMQNPFAIDYSVVNGYRMPGAAIRWGVVWNFSD